MVRGRLRRLEIPCARLCTPVSPDGADPAVTDTIALSGPDPGPSRHGSAFPPGLDTGNTAENGPSTLRTPGKETT